MFEIIKRFRKSDNKCEKCEKCYVCDKGCDDKWNRNGSVYCDECAVTILWMIKRYRDEKRKMKKNE